MWRPPRATWGWGRSSGRRQRNLQTARQQSRQTYTGWYFQHLPRAKQERAASSFSLVATPWRVQVGKGEFSCILPQTPRSACGKAWPVEPKGPVRHLCFQSSICDLYCSGAWMYLTAFPFTLFPQRKTTYPFATESEPSTTPFAHAASFCLYPGTLRITKLRHGVL